MNLRIFPHRRPGRNVTPQLKNAVDGIKRIAQSPRQFEGEDSLLHRSDVIRNWGKVLYFTGGTKMMRDAFELLGDDAEVKPHRDTIAALWEGIGEWRVM